MREKEQKMKSKVKKTSKKCSVCVGHICVHERGETMTEKQQTIPNIAEQTMDMLEKLLKERENNPKEILRLASRNDLFQVGMDPFCLTAAVGHIEGMRRFLEAGKNPNDVCTTDGSTPLMLATQNRHVKAMEILLSYGADTSILNSDDNNALMLGIKTGDAKVVNTLWPHKGQVDINHRNTDGLSLLHYAVEKRWETCVKVILSCGADVNIQSNSGCTPLMMAALKGDIKVAEVLIAEGADILIEDDFHYTAICHAFDNQENGEEFAKFILCKMPSKDREVYVKNRIERMRNMMEDYEFDEFFTDSIVPVFQYLSLMEPARDILYREKLIPNMLSAIQKFSRHQEVVRNACCVFCSCMYQYNSLIDERFARQFLQARGPEFCLRALKIHTDTGKSDKDFMVSLFYPIVCINECRICQTWIAQNTNKIEPYMMLRDSFDTLKWHDEVLKAKGETLWTRFWSEFDHLRRNQRDVKMKELLDEEERERAQKEKKRERKKQKRLREKQKKTERSTEGVTAEMQEKEADDDCKMNQSETVKDKDSWDDCKMNQSENGKDKDSGDNIGIHAHCKQNERPYNELTGVPKSKRDTSGAVDDKDIIANMNKSANSKERGKNKAKSKRTEKGERSPRKIPEKDMDINHDQRLDQEDKTESWTKVKGKKSQQKIDSNNDKKKTAKNAAIKTKPIPNVQRFNNSESRKWSDVLCQRQQEVPYKESSKVSSARVVESVVPIQTDDWKEFPSLRESVSRKWEDGEASDSVRSESTADHWDSDDYLTAMTNEPTEECPAWLHYSVHNPPETATSDVYWMDTSEFEKNVRQPLEECHQVNQGLDLKHPANGCKSGAGLSFGLPASATHSDFIADEKQSTLPRDHKCQSQDRSDTLLSKTTKNSGFDIGLPGSLSESGSGLVFLADSDSDPLLMETRTPRTTEKQSACPWIKTKTSAPTLKDVAFEFMNNTMNSVSKLESSACKGLQSQERFETSSKLLENSYATGQNEITIGNISKSNLDTELEATLSNRTLQRPIKYNIPHQKPPGFGSDKSLSHLSGTQSAKVGGKDSCLGEKLDITNTNFPPLMTTLSNNTFETAQEGNGTEILGNSASHSKDFICSFDENCRKITLVELEAEMLKQFSNGKQAHSNQPIDCSSEMRRGFDEAVKSKVAVIQPIGFERKIPVNQAVGTTIQPTRGNSSPQQFSGRESPLRNLIEGLESAGLTMTFDQNTDYHSSRLPSNNDTGKEVTISGNCSLGDTILRNALNIKHKQEDIAFLDDFHDESGKDVSLFPGFHDPDERTPDEARLTLNRHKMEMIQFVQLHNYYRQLNMNSAAIPTNDFQYYASAMGLSKQNVDNIVRGEMSYEVADTENNCTIPNTVQFVSNNSYNVKSSSNINTEESPSHDCGSEMITNNDKNMATSVCDGSPTNDPAKTETNPRDLPNTDVSNWIKNSSRWRSKLEEISRLPDHLRRRVGDIIIPTQSEKYKISYSDEGAVLGFLMDGSEVAVVTLDLKSRPVETSFLQTLVSDHFAKFFLVRYKIISGTCRLHLLRLKQILSCQPDKNIACIQKSSFSFVIEGGVCYLAMELHEYTLAEYISLLRLNQGVDPLTVNRLTWQLLKGLTSLHENCAIAHGNIMPSNILVDTEGRLRLSEYGFPRVAANHTQLMNTKVISEDRNCWTPTEVMTESESYSLKSDVQVAGMMICYIMSGGKHPYGENSLEITVSIQANWPKVSPQQSLEISSLVTDMLVMPPADRPEFTDILKHPYFWADEKKLRFVLIAGSDVLRDMKHGVPTSGAVSGAITMIDILNSAEQDATLSDWTSHVEHPIMKEMRSFRQYKSSLVELVLFVYNCCLHFDRLPAEAREIMEEPTKYFLGKFPGLFLSVYRAIRASARRDKVCYRPFF